MEFANVFQESMHKKIITGIQQLYIIGLYDSLPVQKVLTVFKRHLPIVLFRRLNFYIASDPSCIKRSINWLTFKVKLDKLNLELCINELVLILTDIPLSEKNVKTFHINKNNVSKENSTEPTIRNTIKMVYRFLASIYQRNILASLIKYILLGPLLKTFETSQLLCQRTGIFYLMHKRLKELVTECVLTSFNGSNYDNYLLCNHLIYIQTQLRQKIFIFKKGAAISSILCINKINFSIKDKINSCTKKTNKKKPTNLNKKNCLSTNIANKTDVKTKQPKKLKSKKKTNIFNRWLMKLYIKDVRNLVSASMSLDKIGQLFSLPVSKLCFPYNQATSIGQIKTLTSLKPEDNIFWKDSFFGKTTPLENRLEAQKIMLEKKFTNLYDYGTYYLIQDCLLLHSIVLTLLKTYMIENSINIFIRRNYSQSNLAYQQFFIIEPSKQIEKLLAPKEINNTVYNYMIKQAVTGGLCTSFVHGVINKDTIINDHFNFLENPNLSRFDWPNFNLINEWSTHIKKNNLFQINQWKKPFNETGEGIITLDIRSLYPSAAVKKLPVNTPLFYTRFTSDDYTKKYNKNEFWKTLHLNTYCKNAQISSNPNEDVFKLISKPPRFYNEYYALSYYLNKFASMSGIKILRFQSNFTALGQMRINKFPVDGFLSYCDIEENIIYFKIIQYHSVFFHGHNHTCYVPNTQEEQLKYEATLEKKKKIEALLWHYNKHFSPFLNRIHLEYVEIWDCDFLNHQIPKTKNNFMGSFEKTYTPERLLTAIEKKQLTGLLVVKNLQIKKNNQNPIFGFLIQKCEYDLNVLSQYTTEQLNNFYSSKRVISVHKNKNFMVISTEYFNWLKKTFGFEQEPKIYHALFFQLDDYLRTSILTKLKERSDLKALIKKETNIKKRQNYEIKAELIKLMLNSCYGFTLCNISSNKFKTFENRLNFPLTLEKRKNIKSVVQFNTNIFLIEKTKHYSESFPTLLGHVGCYILFNSKIILLKRLYFLLKFLDPRLSQLLYMDTDSAHFLVKHKKLEENVNLSIRFMFQTLFNKHFETGSKISGIWVEEGFYENAEYIGEKCYRLYNLTNANYLTHMKGLNAHFQKEYHLENIDRTKLPFLAYNQFFKTPDFLIFKTHMSKNLFANYVPNKRYFISATGSLPLKL